MEKIVFEEKHKKPDVITLQTDTTVINMSNTSNRHPQGIFNGSWIKYWIAFSGECTFFTCSVDGKPIWVEGFEESCKACRETIRFHELTYYPNTKKNEDAYNKREADGAHIRYNGKIYIVPMCSSHNTSLRDKEVDIILKTGTKLVEEVDPIID